MSPRRSNIYYMVANENLLRMFDNIIRKIEESRRNGYYPDILIVGSPGTGKSTLASMLSDVIIPASAINETNFPTYIEPAENKFKKKLHELLEVLNSGGTVLLDDIHQNPMIYSLLNSYIGRKNIEVAIDGRIYTKRGIIIATTTNLEVIPQEFLSRFYAFEIIPNKRLLKGLIVYYWFVNSEENINKYFNRIEKKIKNMVIVFLTLKDNLPEDIENIINRVMLVLDAFKKDKGFYPIRELTYTKSLEEFLNQLETKYKFNFNIDDISKGLENDEI